MWHMRTEMFARNVMTSIAAKMLAVPILKVLNTKFTATRKTSHTATEQFFSGSPSIAEMFADAARPNRIK